MNPPRSPFLIPMATIAFTLLGYLPLVTHMPDRTDMINESTRTATPEAGHAESTSTDLALPGAVSTQEALEGQILTRDYALDEASSVDLPRLLDTELEVDPPLAWTLGETELPTSEGLP